MGPVAPYSPVTASQGGGILWWQGSGWSPVPKGQASRPSRGLSAQVADEYVKAGFTCVVQDNIYGPDVLDWLASVTSHPRHLVVLRPSVDVVAARDEARYQAIGKVAYRGGYTPVQNDADVLTTPQHLGLWLDTSRQGPDQTVAEILARQREALIG